MNIRSNVRRRRRERIEQLIGQRPAGDEGTRAGWNPEWPELSGPAAEVPDLQTAPPASASFRFEPELAEPPEEPDPEKWWKERQRKIQLAGSSWSGAGKSISPSRLPAAAAGTGSGFSGFFTGFAVRLALAAVLFGVAWAWFRSDLPGSGEARAWATGAVTQDMDFQAVEAWYEQTFGGSPSFLPMFRSRAEAQEVFGGWKRSDAILPVEGRIVQSYEQDGSGVRIAAPGDSRVKAVYAGRVLQVESGTDGKATVLIQHAGKIVTVYGNLQYPEVRAGDWVEAGEALGSVPPPLDAGGESLLYFAVRQNGNTVDPAEVVPFD